MDKTALEQKLKDLLDQIEDFTHPDDRHKFAGHGLEGLLNRPMTETRQSDPQDWLDSLRLRIQYLLFDLEATRRENSYLKRLLEGPED
ncbi:MAG TPA: hypothetical protein PK052_09905 [Anaerohalosphaeraceae bacterium]|nr:hypothetical protein [Phycisphaerae bacterium]HOK95751.1 hypothetical protein [Anaerohalosphaeraceae bacterium]HOL32282.1 hypothetical protein [Anaerohalosphaeraceae bacterium]HOM77115.1 hypothetical protein [Anaerohalosphaeraceae bacterium]HPC64301.1 hypothetical protein [Anaerohalosphaeraceae bacterium]